MELAFWRLNATQAATFVSAIVGCLVLAQIARRAQSAAEKPGEDAVVSDPGLLKKHSTQRDYSTPQATYKSIRTFYSPHPHADKLPTKPTPLPLLVFIHGLGGSVAQFSPLLTSLVNAAPCLAIDLPGCGLSAFENKSSQAYTSETLASLVAEAIRQHRDAENGQKVVLIGHSMGCSLGALLASTTSPVKSSISEHIIGLISICPRAEPLSAQSVARLSFIRYMPIVLFDIYRAIDRRGGSNSASVSRYVGVDADKETRKMQLRFNQQSRSPVFIDMVLGLMSDWSTGKPVGGLPGELVWAGLKVPTFCIAGESDLTSPPENVRLIAEWLGHHTSVEPHEHLKETLLPVAAGDMPMETTSSDTKDGPGKDMDGTKMPKVDAVTRTAGGPPVPTLGSRPPFVLKTAILPKPAPHGLLYAASTVRLLSGLIQAFLSGHVDHRLSLGWQLQHLTTEGKWDVKNLEKWTKVQPVSEPIAGIFRAMKTLREVDDIHTPKVFAREFGAKSGKEYGIRMVIDLSHDTPVYDPQGLENGGIEYHKFPTVSKLPPTSDEMHAFVALVTKMRQQIAAEANPLKPLIAVHCHYGFNRTGAAIVGYLVEEEGYTLQDALDLFAEKRPPGIRHEHFVNELFVRYTPNLDRRASIYSNDDQ